MKLTVFALTAIAALASALHATEFHVATTGNDANRGTKADPLRTIQHAADLAQPGDLITVHAGTYRERVTPPRGGISDRKRIVYRAAPGEKVEIKGSEVVRGWVKAQDDVWKATVPNSFFGSYNPYSDLIRGDWFDRRGRDHHTGAVYLDGEWLTEAASLDEVLKPAGTNALWFGQVDKDNTTLWAQFKGRNPNEQLVEINARRAVFYPEKPGVSYLTVRGFTLRHAATQWAPPTAEQVGLIGTHWSQGWIIENNVISHSRCSGVTLGKYGDEWDNKSANSAEGYVLTIDRALTNGWNGHTVGHHIVRNNTISDCEQTGICGSLGAVFSRITGNHIYNIWTQRRFSGAEIGGIKLHAAIDVVLEHNVVHHAGRGLWLDWMAQGTRVSRNLFYENDLEDLFVEVNHGPFVVDNNLLLSRTSLNDMSEGGAYAHNLFTGRIVSRPEPRRSTPYHPAHSTAVAGLKDIRGADNRFYNNIFVGNGPETSGPAISYSGEPQMKAGYGLWVYDTRELPLQTGGNVYFNGARPYVRETKHIVRAEFDPGVKIVEQDGRVLARLELGSELEQTSTALVTTALLGKASIPELQYENADGSPLKIDTDFFGIKRSKANLMPGPFENHRTGSFILRDTNSH